MTELTSIWHLKCALDWP